MKKHLRLRTVVLGLAALIVINVWHTSDSKAIPAKINTYSACPPQSNNINVWLDEDNSPTDDARVFNIPFDTGTKTFLIDGQSYTFDNYLRGVLAAEVGGPQWNTKTLQAKTILARTVVYHRCGNKSYGQGYLEDGQRGVPGQKMQEYRYNKIFTFSSAEQTRYQQAVDFGDDPYVTYNGDTFDVQYRDVSREWTNGSNPPHQSVYDPAGLSHSGEQSKSGFIQINADHWADGMRPNNIPLPPYDDPFRFLGHYLSGIGFVGLDPTPPDDYRFNILHFGGMDDRADNPLIVRTGETYRTSFIIQNTGNNTWSLNCYDEYPWHDTALSYHLYGYPDKQYLSQYPYFEGERTALCGGALAPGKEYPDQSQGSDTAYADLYVNAPPGEYWLRLDVEFYSAYRWGSRLHPQDNQNNAQWPTQDIRVRVIPNLPPVPSPDISSGQTPDQWNKNNTVTLRWAAVNDPLLAYYRVCRDKRDDGQGDSCDNVSGTSYSRTLADGIYDFEVTAVASDGKQSNTVTIDNIKLDATPPTVQLNPLPVRVQAFTHLINWNSNDANGSGLTENLFEYRIWRNGQNIAGWDRVTAVKNPAQTSILFDFPGGRHGDVYEFCLKTRDGADNWSAASCASTTFNPDPELHVSPPQLTWFTVYSNTFPNTQTLTIENYGGDTLNWTATTPFTLAALGQTNGTAPSIVPVVLTHPVGITATYQGYITIASDTPGARNTPQEIKVTILVLERDSTLYLPVIYKE